MYRITHVKQEERKLKLDGSSVNIVSIPNHFDDFVKHVQLDKFVNMEWILDSFLHWFLNWNFVALQHFFVSLVTFLQLYLLKCYN